MSLPAPAVYINGAPAGDVAILDPIPAAILVEVRYLPPRNGVTDHGQASAGGEILLYTALCRRSEKDGATRLLVAGGRSARV